MIKQSIIARLSSLKTTSTPELKVLWKELFESDAPPFNRQYLESRLAYRIQELAYGGLSKETRKRLRETAAPHAGNSQARKPTIFSVGTVLRREWRGGIYTVTVLADGYEYEGKRYRSLSRVTREITGTAWNGHAFFGLRKKSA